ARVAAGAGPGCGGGAGVSAVAGRTAATAGRVAVAASRRIPADPARVFALALNTGLFPSLFPGFGPIPAVLSVERLDDGPLAVGSRRRVRSSDGGELLEQVLELVEARRHRYVVSGFRPPFSWWVQAAEADWRFTPCAEGTEVRWEYRFAARGWLAGTAAGHGAGTPVLPPRDAALSGAPRACQCRAPVLNVTPVSKDAGV